MSACFASFEQCLEVTDYKTFDKGNVLPKSMEYFLHFLKIMKLRIFFSESSKIQENFLEELNFNKTNGILPWERYSCINFLVVCDF